MTKETAFSFTVLPSSNPVGASRQAVLHTPHGDIPTPNFIFCATKAAIKAVATDRLPKLGCHFILGNTYHLMLRPTSSLIKRVGGLHRFMSWEGPLLSDSGGYQIFAMGHGSVAEEVKRRKLKGSGQASRSLVSIDEEGACFRSYVDGKKIFLTPELSMQVQHELGVDFAVQLDECTPYHISKRETEASMHRSMRWGDRSLDHFHFLVDNKADSQPRLKTMPSTEGQIDYIDLAKKLEADLIGKKANPRLQQQLVGVVQGGVYRDLRQKSVDYVSSRPFFSNAIGGSLGRDKAEMYDVVSMTMEMVRSYDTRWVHLLGVGGIADIFHGVENGIDTFDCVLPTRIARHGHAIVPFSQLVCEKVPNLETKETAMATQKNDFDKMPQRALRGVLNLRNAIHKDSKIMLDPSAKHFASQTYSRAYIHHLLKAKELSAMSILSEHNIAQMTRLFSEIRNGIANGNLREVKKYWLGYA